jgi:signal transduction histidine kinase
MTGKGPLLAKLRTSPVAAYGLAIASPALATLLKIRLDWIGRDAPLAIYLGAVMVAAWFGGTGPGLLATALSLLATAFLFLPPYGSLNVGGADDVIRLVFAGIEGSIISVLAGQLLQSKTRLQQQFAERLRVESELRTRTSELLHALRMRAIGDLAAQVAHDVNNMAAIVSANTNLLITELLPCGHPAVAVAETIRQAVERAVALTKRLMVFARTQASNSVTVDLHAVFRSAEPLLRGLAGSHVEIELVPGAQAPYVSGDPMEMEQVLVNLVANARDAMPEGGRITIETADDPQGALLLTVRDTGVGMDESTRARVFEPFFTTKSAAVGTGLGLSVVCGVVEAMGGSITVESRPGKGTIFRFCLPRASGVRPAPQPPDPKSPA